VNYIITEHQEQLIINSLLSENLDYGERRLYVKKFLDDNFKRGTIDRMDDNGDPSKYEVVVLLTKDKKPVKTMTDKQLFYYLQSKFKNILPDNERDEFLKDTIKKWYSKRITKNGSSLD
jgi:hypothetical protein